MSGSPEISAAKRVQRTHWMQRSRSSSTRSEIGIGFAKWRFSSMYRDSRGPNARVRSWSGHSPPRSQTGQSSGWFTSRNSRIPSCTFLQRLSRLGLDRPCRRSPGVAHTIWSPRRPSTSTRHMRHMPTGFMRSCQRNRGMSVPCSWAALIGSSPFGACTSRPSTVIVTWSGPGRDGQHVLPRRRPLADRLVGHRPPPPGAATGIQGGSQVSGGPSLPAISSRK